MANEAKVPTFNKSARIGPATVFTGSLFTADSMSAIAQVEGRVRVTHGTTFSDLVLERTGPMILDRLVTGENLSAAMALVSLLDGKLLPKISPSGRRGIGSSQPYVPQEMCVGVVPNFQLGGGLRFSQGAWTRLAGYGITAALPTNFVVGGAGAAQGATSIAVITAWAGTAPIPAGTRLNFGGATKRARTTAEVPLLSTGPVAVEPLPAALAAADTAPVSHPDAIPNHAAWLYRSTVDYDEWSFGLDDGGRQIPGVTFQGMFSFQPDLPEDSKLGFIGDPMSYAEAIVPGTFFFGQPT